jgi:hypothetical protein
MREFLTFIASFVVAMTALFGAILGLLAVGERWQCAGYERDTGRPTKYGNAMCFIQDGGQWYSWEEYKNRLVARGEMKK